ncbi:PREDICTED: UPF0725 protein At4g28920-like [Camelina sativa]|uniref:UPF0725 protein At4g28920-like n=1 Tax=Camelina sativa TaxID=90675 RepID=A0ABM0U5Z0_CAMSA|nr:PREDICTED: UPF0725 protein At4g28920-like [Camelina sativa]
MSEFDDVVILSLIGQEITPEETQKYLRQVQESDGFDIGYFRNARTRINPVPMKDESGYTHDIELYARLGLHCYNLQKGTNLRFLDIPKYNTEGTRFFSGYYITSEAHITTTLYALFKLPTGPRATPIEHERRWEDEVIDDFYKGEMPKWLTKDELAATKDKGQYYELQESDLLENEWLHLYAEFALYLNWRGFPVIVHTQESGEESPQLKLKANNAIFYMSFKRNFDHQSGNYPVEYQAIVRKTMDRKPGHIRLEVQSWAGTDLFLL